MTHLLVTVLGAIVIGLSLGLLGSGGSILTLPVLLYGLKLDPTVAIASSLAIVALIALAASLPYIWRKQVQWSYVLRFGIPGMLGTYLGAWLSIWTSDLLQLLLFALVMLLAAKAMLRPKALPTGNIEQVKTWKIILDGLLVGIITGLVGVGGGFLIVPALVVLGGLSMSQAIASSLVIIVLKSSSGFIKYLDVLAQQNLQLDSAVIAWIALIGIMGSWLGTWIAPRIPQARLQQVFGWMLVIMGIYIATDSLLAMFN
ncbi:sulfite exporter TauE/SafE family protein [Alginatibacterium sediminis]|uniref:sulfite exporter TauE/SafE family protein n=1 Tax=Alginatibacterium sediminis TaxID=2164068 RepID=UPI0018F6929C|nr:sulfite exporter TauE/SafE family protein [Alginatibacterium sediminis]